jgi:hypothetical protein
MVDNFMSLTMTRISCANIPWSDPARRELYRTDGLLVRKKNFVIITTAYGYKPLSFS